MIVELGLGLTALYFMKKGESVKTPTSKARSIPDWDHLFKKEAAKYGFDWKILKAICMQESTLGRNPRVVRGLQVPTDIEGSKSTDGLSWGLMQVRIKTARDFDPAATEVKLNNPEYSVKIAAQYLAWVFTQFKDMPALEYIIKAYNQGVRGTKEEIAGIRAGAAHDYWKFFQSNYAYIKGET